MKSSYHNCQPQQKEKTRLLSVCCRLPLRGRVSLGVRADLKMDSRIKRDRIYKKTQDDKERRLPRFDNLRN